MSDEQYSDIQYAIYAMERCARGLRAMGARVEAANPDDPYSAVHYHDDAESVEKGVAALKRITAEQPQAVSGRCVAPPCRCETDGQRRVCAYWHPAPPAAAASEADQRESFEAWLAKRWAGDRSELTRREDGEYVNGRVEFAWCAWCAAQKEGR